MDQTADLISCPQCNGTGGRAWPRPCGTCSGLGYVESDWHDLHDPV